MSSIFKEACQESPRVHTHTTEHYCKGEEKGPSKLKLMDNAINPLDVEDPRETAKRFYDGVKPGKDGRPKLVVSSTSPGGANSPHLLHANLADFI